MSFTNKDFIKEIRKANHSLYDLINTKENLRTQKLYSILSLIRNTIHSSGVAPYQKYNYDSLQPFTLFELPEKFRDAILENAEYLGNIKNWGLSKEKYTRMESDRITLTPSYYVFIDPYIFSKHLLEMWFEFLENIAELIILSIEDDDDRTKALPFQPMDIMELSFQKRLSILL